MRLTTFPGPTVPGARTALRIGLAAGLLGLAAACGGSGAAGSTTAQPQAAASIGSGRIISKATLKRGQPVPRPAQKPVLTVTGKISATNKGATLVLDQHTLDQMGLVQVGMYEPWAKKNLEFRGVWLQDVLAIADAGADSTRVHITALDDYQVDLTMADIRRGGIMLATHAGDGSSLPVDKGGPTRIVFLDGVKAGANADQWIWSVKTIDVQ